jgi:hypothetical protein
MTGDRYVLLGLAQSRSAWFGSLAHWATAASIPGEFIKCLSAEELRARLDSGRRHSAVIIDSSHPALDRDLVAAARGRGVTVLAVGADGRPDWSAAELGVAAVLAAAFTQEQLLEALGTHCRRVSRADRAPLPVAGPAPGPWRGRLLAVCGPGGTGASSVAISLAQAYASDARTGGRALLADFALRGDQAMLHDSGEVTPGIQEMVEAHRTTRPSPAEIEAMTFLVAARRYRLLLGLRQSRFWAAIRPAAFDATLDSLRAAFDVVVADVDSDLEGEADGGSLDVQDRNHMTRAVVARADVVLVIGRPGMKGLHAAVRTIVELLEHGVASGRVLPVFVASPKHPRARAQLTAALASLLESRDEEHEVSAPLHLPDRNVDELLRDGMAMPAALFEPLQRAVDAVLERQLDSAPPVVEPVLVAPGSLGRWADDELAFGEAGPE